MSFGLLFMMLNFTTSIILADHLLLNFLRWFLSVILFYEVTGCFFVFSAEVDNATLADRLEVSI